MEKLIQKIKADKKTFIILIAIMAVGIFLRTYHYEELLRFGKDQARDAAIIRDIIDEKQPLPLLGPRAFGTEFKMGPIFYYFQYASAKIFGFSPVTIAFPDLAFSLLTIPVFFIFLRRYFQKNISLALTALYTVSFFAVQNGRFAWNPNSLLLFSLLFLHAYLRMTNLEQPKKIFWPITAGIAIGVGVQLHTLFLLVILAVFTAFSAYLVRKKHLTLKNIAIVLAVALVLNLPQIFSEFRTGGENTKAFFTGISKKNDKNSTLIQSVAMDAAWHVQSNTMFLSSLGDDANSDFTALADDLGSNEKGFAGAVKYFPTIFRLALGTIFSIAGYFLIGYFLAKETDERKKVFLELIAAYIFVAFIFFVLLSESLALRYFLILQFIPFLFLGFLIKLAAEKYGQKAAYVFFAVIFLLGGLNVYTAAAEANAFLSGRGDPGIAIWGEEKVAGDFILSHSAPSQEIYFVYVPQSANKFIRSLSYFKEDIDAPSKPNNWEPLENKDAAYFSLTLHGLKDKKGLEKKINEKGIYEMTDFASYGRVGIYKLELLK